jgi:hypothetical protein
MHSASNVLKQPQHLLLLLLHLLQYLWLILWLHLQRWPLHQHRLLLQGLPGLLLRL